MSRYHTGGVFTMIIIMVAILLFCSCDLETETDFAGSVVGRATFANSDSHEDIIVSLEKLEGDVTRTVSRAINDMPSHQSSRTLEDQTRTNASGDYSFDSIPEGIYTLYASSKDSKEQAVFASLEVVKGRTVTAPDLELTAVGDIKGRVMLDTFETGNIGFIVFIAGTSYMAITDDAGNFTIPSVPSGTGYKIVIMRGTDTYQWREEIEVEAGSTTDLGTVQLNSENFPGIISILWQGELEAAPDDPELYWAYYNTGNGNSYIYNGTDWDLLARAGSVGSTGPTGPSGLSICWMGEFESEPANFYQYWAYYNSTDGVSYIYNGSEWDILAQNGTSVVWVNYDSNLGERGTVPSLVLLHPGESVVIQDNVGNLMRTGYAFSGWNTRADGNGLDYIAGDSYDIETGVTLYAKWTANSYTVTYDANGGSGTMDVQTCIFNTPERLTKNLFTRPNYAFAGWATSAEGEVMYPDQGDYTTGATNTTLYATWTANTYTVSFDTQNESTANPSSMTVSYDQPYGALPVASRYGYIFEGWFTTVDEAGSKIENTTIVHTTSDLTLYAKWTVTVGGPGEAGGVIFFDDASDGVDDFLKFRYLEAAPEGWNGMNEDPSYVFGVYRPFGTRVNVGTETQIGSGKTNTNLLVGTMKSIAYDSSTTTTAEYAAKICDDLIITVDGIEYGDWFLPSIDELSLMIQNLHNKGYGGFSGERYWSSSENTTDVSADYVGLLAWVKILINGYSDDQGNRTHAYSVRPIRAF